MFDRRGAYWVNPSELEERRVHRGILDLLRRGARVRKWGRGKWGKFLTKHPLADLIELRVVHRLEVSTRMASWQLRGKGTWACEEGRLVIGLRRRDTGGITYFALFDLIIPV